MPDKHVQNSSRLISGDCHMIVEVLDGTWTRGEGEGVSIWTLERSPATNMTCQMAPGRMVSEGYSDA